MDPDLRALTTYPTRSHHHLRGAVLGDRAVCGCCETV